MKVSIVFDPAEDNSDDIVKTVLSIYGVETKPVMVNVSDVPATNAPTLTGPEAVKDFCKQALANNPGGIPEQSSISPEAQAFLANVPATQPGTVEGSGVAGNVEVDVSGLPWDDRIHVANGDRLTKSGHWKRKRGTTTAEREAIEAELRAGLANLPTPSNRAELPSTGIIGTTPAAPDLSAQLAGVASGGVVPSNLPNAAPANVGAINIQTDNATQALPQIPANVLQAAAQQATKEGRFVGLIDMLRANGEDMQYSISAITNEVSACIGENVLTLADLGNVTAELTGQADASPSAFFSLINMAGFWDRIAASLDALIATKNA